MKQILKIRNSTAEFLIFTSQSGADSIEVKVFDENVWLTQKLIAELFTKGRSTITEHLKNIFDEDELDENLVCREFRHTGNDGKNYNTKFYNLDAIISVGYRVNSKKATQFRQWATQVLREFAIKGYVLDKKRLENGSFLGEAYFDRLLEEIRDIRLSERKFYQKMTDIYTTSLDYSKDDSLTKAFFKKVQNKMHYAIHGHTAAELVVERADSQKEFMGLSSWHNAPEGKIMKSDVVIAKNYLQKDELESLGLIVSAYLDLAESRAKRKIPMTMKDWSERLDLFLKFDDRKVLQNAGSISAQIAKEHALSEFEKYRVVQDKMYRNDFDKLIEDSQK